jgi:hypothetical protein
MKCYKMMPRRFAEDLVNRGNVKIKTLFECQAAEDVAGIGRSDPQEGEIYHDMTIPSFRSLTPEEQADPQALQDLWERGYEPSNIIGMEDTWVLVQTHRLWRPSRDVYVFCVSRKQTRTCELNFWSGEDDVWVEIFDWPAFLNALNTHMVSLGHQALGVHDIGYRPRLFGQDVDARMHPATVKPRSFKHEHETRGIWQPGAWPASWFTVDVPALASYCRIQRAVEPRTVYELSIEAERR